MLEYCRRRNRLSDLVGKCQRVRPTVSWPTIKQVDASESERVREEAKTGLQLLAQLANEPQVRGAVRDYQQDFKMAQGGIETIRFYKNQHDLFQEIETSYNVIIHNDRERLPEDNTAWSNIVTNQLLLKEPIHELIETAAAPLYAVRAGYWLATLRRGQESLQTAIEEKDLDELETALRLLFRALDRGLPRVNGLLVDAVIDLPLNRLVEVMKAVHDRLQAGLSPEAKERIVASILSLGQLDESLTELVFHHNEWQGLDDELRRIDTLLTDNDISELELTWPDLQTMAEGLLKNNEEGWGVSLERLGDRLDKTLSADPPSSPATINGIFRAYRLQVSRRFRAVDDKLLSLCEDLRKIGEPLDLLLRAII
ncbi:MAG: hypothetical protein GY803_17570 [Chloroflexi bacterium]|nr:hypothetical protein [Chloroflexota bacterium]